MYVYIYIKVCFTTILRGKIKKKVEEQWDRRPKVMGVAAVPNLVPRINVGGQRLLQVLHDKINRRHDFLS
jgi:hypothetical protein